MHTLGALSSTAASVRLPVGCSPPLSGNLSIILGVCLENRAILVWCELISPWPLEELKPELSLSSPIFGVACGLGFFLSPSI